METIVNIKAMLVVMSLLFLSGCAAILGIAYNSFKTTDFEVRGEQLYMDGLINQKTVEQLRTVLKENPTIKEIVLLNVPGSVDDEANLVAARMVRNNNLNTRLLKNSEVASGGTDFFLAGVERQVAEGARVGVHAWQDGLGTAGNEVPKDHPQHQLYLNYYHEMGIPAAFYWYTLKAAPAEEIHWMSNAEMNKFGVISN